MGKTLNIELSESTYKKVVKEAKSLDRSVRKMVSLLVERGLEPKPSPLPQAPVYQPQPQPQPNQYVYDWHNDPMARPQWQIDEIDRLNNEKIKRVNELGRERDDELREYMELEGWTQEGAEAIVGVYDQQIKDVEKEIDEKLDAIYNN